MVQKFLGLLDILVKVKIRGMRLVGITTTVPVEIMLAGGVVPADLNNLFITHPRREQLLAQAQGFGFASNLCTWVKGIFQVCREMGIKEVVGVVRGDCSSTEKLLEIFSLLGIKTIPFAYPPDRSPGFLKQELEKFAGYFQTSLEWAEKIRDELKPIREKLAELDRRTWETDQVSGEENHLWLVSASDFNRSPEKFEKELDEFLLQVRERSAFPQKIRLAYLGVPSIFDDLYQVLEEKGARVVYNEVQREFAMLKPAQNLVEQYLVYTYPYDVFYRAEEIKKQIKIRRIHGIIHYAQTFCHRQIESIAFKKLFSLPVLTLEGDQPAPVDARTRTRIEAFLEMLQAEL